MLTGAARLSLPRDNQVDAELEPEPDAVKVFPRLGHSATLDPSDARLCELHFMAGGTNGRQAEAAEEPGPKGCACMVSTEFNVVDDSFSLRNLLQHPHLEIRKGRVPLIGD